VRKVVGGDSNGPAGICRFEEYACDDVAGK
jgi:hypothetical protein